MDGRMKAYSVLTIYAELYVVTS